MPHMTKHNLPPAEVLRMKTEPELNSGCLLWSGGTTVDGYGEMSVYGRSRRAHRVSYELHHGPIPPGMMICHRCDTPQCVNPDHLYAGTDATNTADRERRGRSNHPRGEAHGRAKLTSEQVAEIRALCSEPGRPTRESLAARYGVSRSLISQIDLGQTWASI